METGNYQNSSSPPRSLAHLVPDFSFFCGKTTLSLLSFSRSKPNKWYLAIYLVLFQHRQGSSARAVSLDALLESLRFLFLLFSSLLFILLFWCRSCCCFSRPSILLLK